MIDEQLPYNSKKDSEYHFYTEVEVEKITKQHDYLIQFFPKPF